MRKFRLWGRQLAGFTLVILAVTFADDIPGAIAILNAL